MRTEQKEQLITAWGASAGTGGALFVRENLLHPEACSDRNRAGSGNLLVALVGPPGAAEMLPLIRGALEAMHSEKMAPVSLGSVSIFGSDNEDAVQRIRAHFSRRFLANAEQRLAQAQDAAEKAAAALLNQANTSRSHSAGVTQGEHEEIEAVIPLGPGGVFAGLWVLAELLGAGLAVEVRAIPIAQEVIEIANALDRNPYEMNAAGCFLIASEAGRDQAAVIGRLTPGPARILLQGENADDVRFLDKPRGILRQIGFLHRRTAEDGQNPEIPI